MEHVKEHKKLLAFIVVVVSALAAIPMIFGGAKKLSCKRHGEAAADDSAE